MTADYPPISDGNLSAHERWDIYWQGGGDVELPTQQELDAELDDDGMVS